MRLLTRLLLPLLFLGTLAFGQGTVATGTPTVVNGVGHPIAGAFVAICQQNPGTLIATPCKEVGNSLIPTYSDITLGTACTLNPTIVGPLSGAGCTNPGKTDGHGNLIAFGANGVFWAEVYQSTVVPVVLPLVFSNGSGGGSNIVLQTNGTNNGSQNLLNLVGTNGVSVTDNGVGSVTISGTGAGGGNVTTTPAAGVSQTITQIPNGAGTIPSSFNVNILNNVYAVPVPALAQTTCGANWTQSPSGTISIGANTVTLSCGPPGMMANTATSYSAATNWTAIAVSGSGGTEYPFLSGTTCAQQGQSASCTLTFTATLAQNAGFTLGSGSGGLQETLNAAVRPLSPFSSTLFLGFGDINVPPGDYTIKATVSTKSLYGNLKLHFDGALLTCSLSATCFRAGDSDPTKTNLATNIDIYNLVFRPGIVASFYPAFEDNGQGVKVHGIGAIQGTTSGPTTGFSFGALEQVDSDEAYIIDGLFNQLGGASWAHCSTDFVSNAVYITPAVTAPTGSITNSNFNMVACGNAVDNWGGNGLRISNSQLQASSQFTVRSNSTFATNLNLQTDNVYWELGNATNPLGTGQAGIAALEGSVYLNGAEGGPVGKMPKFAATTGSNQLNLYVVAKTSGNASAPFPIGYAISNLTGSITAVWPEFGTTGPPTYDLLVTYGATPFAPYTAIMPGGAAGTNGSITTGLTQAGNCNGKTCSFTFTASASTSAYTIAPTPTYYPSIIGTHGSGCGAAACGVPPLPGTIVLSGNENATQSGQTFASVTAPFLAAAITATGGSLGPLGLVAAAGASFPSLASNLCSTGGLWTSAWVVCDNTNAIQYGARLFAMGAPAGGSSYLADTQGKVIFTTPPGFQQRPGGIITLINCHPEITLSDPTQTLYRETPWNACDSTIGIDNSGTSYVTNAAASLGISNNVSISEYIGTVQDGVNWLKRMTATKYDLIPNAEFHGNVTIDGTCTGCTPVYPGAGIPISTGSAWGTSLSETDGNLIAGVSSAWTKVTALPNGITATTQSASDNSTKVATTAYTDTGLGLKLPISNSVPTGLFDGSGLTAEKAPVAAGFTTTANGNFGYDSTNGNWHFWNGADLLGALVSGSITNGDCAQFVKSTNKITLIDAGGACGTSSMVYPAGSGIPIVVTGTSWGTTLTGTGLVQAASGTFSVAASLPNGTTATTQTGGSADTKVATDAYVDGRFIGSGTAVLGTSAILSGTCASAVTVSASGVATTDVVRFSFNGDPTAITGYIPSSSGTLSIITYPTVNNVNVKVCNSTAGSITPGAVTLNWQVIR